MSSNDSGGLVAAICGGLDGLVEVDVSLLSDQAVRDELLALVRAQRQLAAQVAARVQAFDARNLAPTDGCRDVKGFLVGFAGQPAFATTPVLERGRMLRELPLLFRAAAEGSVSEQRLRVVADLVKDIGLGKAAYLDEYLTTAVTTGTDRQVREACDVVRAHLNPDGRPPDPNAGLARRHLSVFARDGLMRVVGELDPEAGAALKTALDALVRPPTPDDDRTQTQRYADALGDLALAALNSGGLPTVGGEKPHLSVLITPKTLATPPEPPRTLQQKAAAFLEWLTTTTITPPAEQPSGGEDRAWLEWVGEIPPELARRIACDSSVWRTILDPGTSLPLDVGRAYRTAPYWMRRALHVRDRGCRFPGCTAPPQWTDAHHLEHWADGGTTEITKMLLLCRHHHRTVHELGWRIEFDPDTGQVTVWRPNGQLYELGPSQPWTGPTTQRTT